MIGIFCPHHKTPLFKLRYQKNEGRKSRSGNNSPTWRMVEWYYCEQCDMPYKLLIECIKPRQFAV